MKTINEIMEKIKPFRIVPVIAIDSENDAISLADALIRGGLPVAEITFRTTAAAAVICKIRKERPDVIVGAGTILTIENLKAAIDSGAQFGVAPGLNPDIVAEAKKLSFPFIPGIITPSEIEKALSLGCKFLKFFPAGDAGGPKMLKSLCGPYAHTGVKFMPTGGVTPENLGSYLEIPALAAVGGTWIAKKEDISGGKWSEIESRCKSAGKFVMEFTSRK